MSDKKLLKETEKFVQEKLKEDYSGHDWWHIHRVYKLAQHIAEKEKADQKIVSLAALLHDIADWKFNDGDLNAGPEQAKVWLLKQGVDKFIIDSVCEIIRNISFKGAKVTDAPLSLEGRVVQDADRLDAISAIGIARAFAYGGYKHRSIHLPEVLPTLHASFEEYKNKSTTTINHFYEKLLLLKDKLHTSTAKAIAIKRHQLMEDYIKQFFDEWNIII